MCNLFKVQVLLDEGGRNLTDFIKRAMAVLFDSQLARRYNLNGVKGKLGFKKL